MTYQFTYQRVLDVRKIEEDVKARDLAESQKILDETKQKLKSLKDKKDTLLQQDLPQITNARLLMGHSKYVKKLSVEIDNQNLTVNDKTKDVDKKRGDLLETAQAKEMMKKLKEQGRELHRKKKASLDQKECDEISSRLISKKGSK